MPRAIKAPGTTTATMPHSADQVGPALRLANPTTATVASPTSNCAATTRQGEIDGRISV
jgi:hypothetical protein